MAWKGPPNIEGQHTTLPSFVTFNERHTSLLNLDEDSFCHSSFGECMVPGLVMLCGGRESCWQENSKKTKQNKKSKRDAYINDMGPSLYYVSNKERCL